MHKFVIRGRPVSQKNNRELIRVKGKPRSVPSREAKSYSAHAVTQLQTQRELNVPILGRLSASLAVYQGERQAIDIDNAIQAPLDALQKAAIIKNDYQIEFITAIRKRDKHNPRVEITLVELERAEA